MSENMQNEVVLIEDQYNQEQPSAAESDAVMAAVAPSFELTPVISVKEIPAVGGSSTITVQVKISEGGVLVAETVIVPTMIVFEADDGFTFTQENNVITAESRGAFVGDPISATLALSCKIPYLGKDYIKSTFCDLQQAENKVETSGELIVGKFDYSPIEASGLRYVYSPDIKIYTKDTYTSRAFALTPVVDFKCTFEKGANAGSWWTLDEQGRVHLRNNTSAHVRGTQKDKVTLTVTTQGKTITAETCVYQQEGVVHYDSMYNCTFRVADIPACGGTASGNDNLFLNTKNPNLSQTGPWIGGLEISEWDKVGDFTAYKLRRNGMRLWQNYNYKKGQFYTFSCWMKRDATLEGEETVARMNFDSRSIEIVSLSMDGVKLPVNSSPLIRLSADKFQRFVCTFIVKNKLEHFWDFYLEFYTTGWGSKNGQPCGVVYGYKMEHGTQATAWSEAPQDHGINPGGIHFEQLYNWNYVYGSGDTLEAELDDMPEGFSILYPDTLTAKPLGDTVKERTKIGTVRAIVVRPDDTRVTFTSDVYQQANNI